MTHQRRRWKRRSDTKRKPRSTKNKPDNLTKVKKTVVAIDAEHRTGQGNMNVPPEERIVRHA